MGKGLHLQKHSILFKCTVIAGIKLMLFVLLL